MSTKISRIYYVEVLDVNKWRPADNSKSKHMALSIAKNREKKYGGKYRVMMHVKMQIDVDIEVKE